MPRSLALAAFFALVVGCTPVAAPLAPVPPGAGKPVLYFPTQVGTKWVYEQNWDDDYVGVVTDVEQKDGRYIVTVATTSLDDPELQFPGIEKFLVSTDGVFMLGVALESETDRQELNPPSCLLKLPCKTGDQWGDNPRTGQYKRVATIETVKVPLGTFEAIRVDVEVPSGQIGAGHYAQWYAPGLGKVKLKANDKIIQMKSFTLPKD